VDVPRSAANTPRHRVYFADFYNFMMNLSRAGMLYGLAAYSMWGAIPIYFRWLGKFASSYDILAHRIVWSALLLMAVLTLLRGRWTALWHAINHRNTALLLILSSVLIAVNWYVYIYGVETRRVVHCSLGYFITPLVNVALGVFLLGERFRRLQGVALALGATGMLILACLTDSFPWIAFSLAASFSVYGLIRKLAAVETLVGLAVESLLLAPLALGYLWQQGTAWQQTDTGGHWMLILSGPATVLPLYCFGQAARLLPLSTLGFLQYLSPSLQFLVAVLLFDEPLGLLQALAFGTVWLALGVFSLDVLQQRRKPAPATEPPPAGEMPPGELRQVS
jgi:chloramphenicol-sensitive protein RarD